MIKEIDHWLQKAEAGGSGTSQYAQGPIFDNINESSGNDEEDQIKLSIVINKQIDYSQVFSLIA